jgi:hypothetical protein
LCVTSFQPWSHTDSHWIKTLRAERLGLRAHEIPNQPTNQPTDFDNFRVLDALRDDIQLGMLLADILIRLVNIYIF